MSRWTYIEHAGERIPSYPHHGEVVSCDCCGREVVVPGERSERWPRLDAGWYLRLCTQTPAWFSVDVQLDVCLDCKRTKPLGEIVANASHRFPPELATELCAAVGIERPW